jgi:DNA topoisomerase-6 subunit B
VWVPFTSESKEAIADYDEIRKEMKLALMECGRKLGTYLRKRQAMQRQAERRDVFGRYIGEISMAVNKINGTNTKKLYEALLAQAKKRTAIADAKLDEEGRTIKAEEELKNDESVVMLESRMAAAKPEEAVAPPEETDDKGRVKLTSKKAKKKRKSGEEEGLF